MDWHRIRHILAANLATGTMSETLDSGADRSRPCDLPARRDMEVAAVSSALRVHGDRLAADPAAVAIPGALARPERAVPQRGRGLFDSGQVPDEGAVALLAAWVLTLALQIAPVAEPEVACST
jgi:hypothetical protein